MSNSAVVIMAGGVGTRLYPASTVSLPKQFIRWPSGLRSQTTDSADTAGMEGEITNRFSLLEETCRRVSALTSRDRLFVATTEEFRGPIAEHLPALPPENIIVEPLRRNSAAACALSTAVVGARLGDDTVVMLVPSDAWIGDDDAYRSSLRAAAKIAADEGGIVVVGIQPTRAATGYGYLRPGESLPSGGYRVAAFVEKPNEERAKLLLEEGCLWNAGIFVWRAGVAREAFDRFLPAHARLFGPDPSQRADSEMQALFELLPTLSVDVGIAERAENVFCVAGQFPWDDLGTWDAFGRVLSPDDDGNASLGAARFLDARDCIAIAADGEIVALGVSDLVIVRYGDTVLVCPRERAQEVGKVAPR